MRQFLFTLIICASILSANNFAFAAKRKSKPNTRISTNTASDAAAIASVEGLDSEVTSEAPCEKALGPDMYAQTAHLLGDTFNMSLVKNFLEEISGEKSFPDGYLMKSRGGDAGRMIARMRLKEIIADMGYQVRFESYTSGVNVIVEIPGSTNDEEVIEVTCHYDSVGNPGADDNGSGMSMMLEMLDHYKQATPERRLRFVFMDEEETGFWGSKHHADKILADNKRKVVGAILVDTIGWHPEGGKTYLGVIEIGKPGGPGSKNIKERRAFAQELYYVQKRIGIRDGLILSPETDGAQPATADHGSYWNAGIPAVLIAAVYDADHEFVNPHYHQQSDLIENINWNYFRRMAQSIVELVAYTSRMKLNNPNDYSPTVWNTLAGLENQNVSIAQNDLIPAAADKNLGLPPRPAKPKKESGGGFFGSTKFGSVGSNEYKNLPMSINRAISRIRESAPHRITLTLLPYHVGQHSSGVRRGILYITGNADSDPSTEILTGDSVESWAAVFKEVKIKTSKIYALTPKTQKFEDADAQQIKENIINLVPGAPEFIENVNVKGVRIDELPAEYKAPQTTQKKSEVAEKSPESKEDPLNSPSVSKDSVDKGPTSPTAPEDDSKKPGIIEGVINMIFGGS